MNIKRLLLPILFFFSISLFFPKTLQAFNLGETLTSENSILTKIQEGIEYFFAFKVESKVAVLEKQAEKRLAMAQGYAKEGDNERVRNLMQSYLQIKEKQNDLLGKTSNEKTLSTVEEKTVEQQKTMEDIKTKIDEGTKQEVVQAQEQVVNQVAGKVVEVKGAEGKAEFFNKVEHIWAPGTGPGGGEAGVVYEGGGKLIFAPGTSAGSGNATSDIKTVEVKTGGGSGGTNTVEGGSQGVVSGGDQKADPGTNDTRTWIDP